MARRFPFPATELPRIAPPTPAVFAARFRARRQPVILVGAALAWSRDREWDLESISALGGRHRFRGYWCEDGVFPGLSRDHLEETNPRDEGRSSRMMSLSRLVATLRGRSSEARRAYLYHLDLTSIPRLAHKTIIPP